MTSNTQKEKAIQALQNNSWGRTVDAPLSLEFNLLTKEDKESCLVYEREYSSLSNTDLDPLGEYMKYARARGDAKESDDITLKLLVTLHHKLDELKKILTNDVKEYLKLESKENIQALGHGVILMPKPTFQKGGYYYARIDLPVFPQRIVPLFFEAIEANVAKVKRMHEKDERDWDGYITSRERALIREIKGF